MHVSGSQGNSSNSLHFFKDIVDKHRQAVCSAVSGYFAVNIPLFFPQLYPFSEPEPFLTAPAPSKPFRRLRLRPKCVGSGGSGSGSASLHYKMHDVTSVTQCEWILFGEKSLILTLARMIMRVKQINKQVSKNKKANKLAGKQANKRANGWQYCGMWSDTNRLLHLCQESSSILWRSDS